MDFLFPQFNRGLPELRQELLRATAIEDFEGYMIRGFALRNEARKHAYLRGPALNGPELFEYLKPHATLRLEVRLEFSGNALPEQDVLVALHRMIFQALPEPGEHLRRSLTLAEVPRVLLLESFREFQEIAMAGDGYDERWKEKVRRA